MAASRAEALTNANLSLQQCKERFALLDSHLKWLALEKKDLSQVLSADQAMMVSRLAKLDDAKVELLKRLEENEGARTKVKRKLHVCNKWLNCIEELGLEAVGAVTNNQNAIANAITNIYLLPTEKLSDTQAHMLCERLTGLQLDHSTFVANKIDGRQLIQLVDEDLRELLGIKAVGLRHRLLRGVHANEKERRRLLSQDPMADVAELKEWLDKQEDVATEHGSHLAASKFGLATCGTVTIAELACVRGLPIGARSDLKAWLLEAASTVA